MNARPRVPRMDVRPTVIAAAVAALVSIVLLASVVALFTREGAPLQEIATAQQACADHPYVSERDACVQSYIAATRRAVVARR